MKHCVILLSLILYYNSAAAQIDTVYSNSHFILIENNILHVKNSNNQTIFKKTFTRPYVYFANVDDDDLDELIVVDSLWKNDRYEFMFYIIAANKNFKIIDSIYSGTFFPFITYSEEKNSLVIETGNTDFDIFNNTSLPSFLPINLWKVQNDKLFLVNDFYYEPFLFENANLIRLLDYYMNEKVMDCDASIQLRGLIAAAFANYINAGEHALASQFLTKYYLCDDLETFKQEMIDLIFPKAKK